MSVFSGFHIGQKVCLSEEGRSAFRNTLHDRSTPMTVVDLWDHKDDSLVLVDHCVCGNDHDGGPHNGKRGAWWWFRFLDAAEEPITPEEIAQARPLPLPEEAFRFVTRRMP